MKNLFIVILLAMGVCFLLGVIYQIILHKKKPQVRYLCDKCGEYDCICNKG